MPPEVLFNPAACIASDTKRGAPSGRGLAPMVDEAVQACPIDSRRALYANVLLSGGNTMFDNFDKRMLKDVQALVDKRYGRFNSSVVSGSRDSRAPQVRVRRHPAQRYAVWAGGSVLGASRSFPNVVVTREAYMEHGPRLVRRNHVFGESF
jgi:actin-related protein 3